MSLVAVRSWEVRCVLSRIIVHAMLFAALGFSSCSSRPASETETAALYRTVCARCHRAPEIEDLPFARDEWKNLLADHRKNNGLDSLITLTQTEAIFRYIEPKIPSPRKKQ